MHSLCWNTTEKKDHHHLQSLIIISIYSFIRSALSLPQSSLRKGGGHVVGGVYPRRAEWRTAPVPRREWDRSGDLNNGDRKFISEHSCGPLAPGEDSQFEPVLKLRADQITVTNCWASTRSACLCTDQCHWHNLESCIKVACIVICCFARQPYFYA